MPKSRLARAVRLTVTGILGTVAFAILAASVVLQGPRLGKLIGGALPENQGKMFIGGVEWHLRALVDIITDAPSPIAVDGLKIVDPEGTVVLDVPHLDARVKLRTLIGGSFSIHDLRVPKVLWRFAAMKGEDKKGAIGFLAALAPKHPGPPAPADAPGSLFEIASSELGDLDAIFDFPGAWGLELRNAHARASLIQSTVDPKHPIFGFDAGPVDAKGGGYLKILDDNVLPFDHVVVRRIATTQDRPDDIFLDLEGGETGKSKLVAKGYFTGIYGATSVPGIDLKGRFERAGDALAAVAAGRKIDGLVVSDGGPADGPGASAAIELTDTFAKLKVKARFDDLDVAFDTYRALGIGFDLGFDAGAGSVDLKKFAFGAPGGGRFELDTHLDTNRLALDAGIRLTGFHTESYLPPPLRALGGGLLDGRIDASANLAPRQTARVRRLDLRLARARAGGLPRVVRVHGDAFVSPEVARTDGLTVAVAGAEATAKGRVLLVKQAVELGLDVVASDLARLLGELGLPPLAKSARLTAKAGGTFDDPEASGDAVVEGISAGGRAVKKLEARFGLAHGTARLDDLSGAAFGGQLKAHGTLRLWNKRASQPLRSPEVELELAATALELAELAGGDLVGGKVSFTASAHGPLDAPKARVRVPGGTEIVALGAPYVVGPIDVELEKDTLEVRALRVAQPEGGTVDITGRVGVKKQDLDLYVVIADLPLMKLPGVADAGVPLAGKASARLHVGGRPDRPELAGTLDLTDVVARGIALGPAHLTFAPTHVGGVPGVSVIGELFSRLHVEAEAALTKNGPLAHGTITFQRVALDPLLPELAEFGDGKGMATGRVTVDVQPGKPLALDVLLSELWLSIARGTAGESGETIVQRVRVEATSPLHVTVKGDHVALDKVSFATDGGTLSAEGRLDGQAVSGAMSGHLDLELLQPFLLGAVQSLSGDLKVEVKAGGTLTAPDLRGQVAIVNAIKVRPKDFPSDVTIGSGVFALGAGSVSVENVAVTVEGSTLRFSGGASLGAGFQPEDVSADLSGDVSAKLLAYVAPDAITDAQGTARIKAHLGGTLTKPEVKGRLDLGAIDFRLRDVGTEVQVKSGIVELSNDGVVLHNVKVVLDEQGSLVIGASGVRAGRVQFKSLVPFVPGNVDLPLHGEHLAYRSSGTFEVEDVGFDLTMRGNVEDGFTLGGETRLVSGRVVQDFKVQSLVISSRVDESSVRPFYEGKPLLENLALDLTVRTVGEGFVVQNNIAPEIHVEILIHVGGTLSEPAIAGDVRPTDGRFNLPGMRGDFDLVSNANHVIFVDTKSIADGETPELDIQATSIVTDANGADHNVRMRIHGPVRESQIDLSTDDGLDRTQTAFLLLTGRTTTESQRVGTQNPTVGANISTGADVAGQLTRDTLANLMEPYIDSTFFKLTGFNLRLTVGPDGFQGRIRRRISRKFSLQADYLQGFQNSSKASLQLNVQFLDYLGIGSSLERITLSSQQGVSETLPTNFGGELRLDYPLRF